MKNADYSKVLPREPWIFSLINEHHTLKNIEKDFLEAYILKAMSHHDHQWKERCETLLKRTWERPCFSAGGVVINIH